MPLDAAADPRTVTATLNYLKRGAERPARHVAEPPPGVPVWNGIDDPQPMRIEDARGREAEFTLDRNGFALISAPTAVADFYSPEEIKRVYYPERRSSACCATSSVPPASLFSTTTSATPAGRMRASRSAGCTTTIPSTRRRGGCAITSATTHRNSCGTASASSMCGGLSAGRCRIRRWRCATRAASPMTT
jgi:hypothetical protein